MRSDHCWSHGRGRPERLVPRRQLDRPRPRVAAERDGERLEHDALDVVLGLGLGQAERVDLHAVAEAQVLGVLHAVALAAELLPQHAHRAQLGVLLDEAHAGVDEEGDAPEDLAHELLVDALAHRVEDRDRVGHRVGDLLDRRRPGLLQVVGADVDRVPARDALDRVGDHVGDQPHRGPGREGVGPAGQELLDDVVLRRALERRRVEAVLLGDDDVERQQPRRRRVDRHRRVHLVERDAVEQRVHVALVGDRDADLADLAAGELVVGVVAGLGGQVEGDRQPGLALARFERYSSLHFLAVEWPEYVRIIHGRSRSGRRCSIGRLYGPPSCPSPARSTSTTSATRSSSAASSSTTSSSTPVRSPRIARCWRRSTTPPERILLTHIHFDHAGATGALVRRWPDVEVWVHERGAPHLIDPSRLTASADAALRRRHGAAVGRGRRGPRGQPARAERRRDDRPVARRVHPRPRLPSRLLPARAHRHGVRRRRRRRARRGRPDHPADARRPTSTSSCGTQSLETVAAWEPARLAVTHFGSYDDVERPHRDDARGARPLGGARARDRSASPTRRPWWPRWSARPTPPRRRPSCRRCRPTRCGRASIATGRRRRTGRFRARGTDVELPRTQDPGTGLGGAWRVIVRNDDHNTFDHVAHTLARYVPGVTVDGGYAIADQIHNTRPGDRVERPPGARRALLGAAQRRRPDDGPARAGLARAGRRRSSSVRCCATSAPATRPCGSRPTRRARSRSWAPRSARSRSRAITSRSCTSPGCPRRATPVRGRARRRARLAAARLRLAGAAACARSPTTTACASASARAAAPIPNEPPWTLTKDEDPEGREHDALRALALRMRDQDPDEWPHLLLMLGDQVYADEVAPATEEFIRARRDVEVPPGLQIADFQEYCRLYHDSWSEPAVRWLLSTVPDGDDLRRPRRHRRLEHLARLGAASMRGHGLVGRAHRRRLHVLLVLPAPRQPLARGPRGGRVLPGGPRRRRRRRAASCATSPSAPTARSPARAGATSATSGARAS